MCVIIVRNPVIPICIGTPVNWNICFIAVAYNVVRRKFNRPKFIYARETLLYAFD